MCSELRDFFSLPGGSSSSSGPRVSFGIVPLIQEISTSELLFWRREFFILLQGSQVPMRWLGGVRHCSRVMVG